MQQSESCPTIAHALDEFELVHFPLNQPIVLRKRESGSHRCFVSFHTSNKTLEFANLAGSYPFESVVELFPCARAQHLSELLNQLVGQLRLRVQRLEQRQRFLFVGLQFRRSAKKQEDSLSCEHRRPWKLIGSLGVLPPLGKVTNHLLVHHLVGQGSAKSDQFPMQLSDIMTARFPSLSEVGQVRINRHLSSARLLFGKCLTPQPTRGDGMANANLLSNGCLREALFT